MVPESIEKPFVSIFLGFNANLIRLILCLFSLETTCDMPDFLIENKHTHIHLNNPLSKDRFVNTGSNVVISSQALVSGNITLVRL